LVSRRWLRSLRGRNWPRQKSRASASSACLPPKQKEMQLRESLEHQTVAADALRVISRSNFDLQTVLDSLVESATRLCEADHSWLFQREGDHFCWSAGFGNATDVHERIRDFFKDRMVFADRGSATGRAALEGKVAHIADVLQDTEYTYGEAQKIGGYRAVLGVPLLRRGDVIGVIFVAKIVPQPFSEKTDRAGDYIR
jgi:GAF domain-containing protein